MCGQETPVPVTRRLGRILYNHAGRRPSNLLYKVAIRLLAQDADSGALPVLYAAVAGITGNSFAGPRHFAHMRGAPELIGRSATVQDADLARRLWAVSEQLTGSAPRSSLFLNRL